MRRERDDPPLRVDTEYRVTVQSTVVTLHDTEYSYSCNTTHTSTTTSWLGQTPYVPQPVFEIE